MRSRNLGCLCKCMLWPTIGPSPRWPMPLPITDLAKLNAKRVTFLKPFSLFDLSRYLGRFARHCRTGLNESCCELILPGRRRRRCLFHSGQFGIWPLHCLSSKIAVLFGLIFVRWQKGLALQSSEPMISTNCTSHCLAGGCARSDACGSSCYGVRTAGVELCNRRSRSA
jgi:hypothetical protein